MAASLARGRWRRRPMPCSAAERSASSLNARSFKAIYSFGGRVSFIGFGEFMASNLDTLWAGHYLGSRATGFYTRATNLADRSAELLERQPLPRAPTRLQPHPVRTRTVAVGLPRDDRCRGRHGHAYRMGAGRSGTRSGGNPPRQPMARGSASACNSLACRALLLANPFRRHHLRGDRDSERARSPLRWVASLARRTAGRARAVSASSVSRPRSQSPWWPPTSPT